MDRRTLTYVFVALLGGVAVALAAATFPTATRPGGPSGTGSGDNGDGTFQLPVPEDSPADTFEPPPFLSELLVVLAVLAAIGMLWYLYNHWRDVLWRILEGALIAGFLLALFHLVSLFFSAELDEAEPEIGFGDDPALGANGEGGDTLVSTDPSSLSVILLLTFALVLVGMVLVMRQRSGDDDETGETGDADPDATAALGRAAGRAADRIADADELDNEIYRAWAEMTKLVGAADPETKTTAEFADDAIEAGMEPDDVAELTRLFEHVRYGTYEPDEADEQRALGLFRRIESAYTEDDS